MIIKWGDDKNIILQETRGISFEEIEKAIIENYIDDIEHSNRGNQRFIVTKVNGYIWLVPYISDGNVKFIKTAFPSRKHNKIYNNS